MHPKKICEDFAKMGSDLFLKEGDVFMKNHENVYDDLKSYTKLYKPWILQYLKGEYSDKEHAMNTTTEKIICCMMNIEQDMNEKINDWLGHDEESLQMSVQLMQHLYDKGWRYELPIATFESEESDKARKFIFDRAMAYFKGVR